MVRLPLRQFGLARASRRAARCGPGGLRRFAASRAGAVRAGQERRDPVHRRTATSTPATRSRVAPGCSSTSPRGRDPSAPGFSRDGTRMAFFRDVPRTGSIQLPVDIVCGARRRLGPDAHRRVAVQGMCRGRSVHARRSAPCGDPSGRWRRPARAPRCRRKAAARRRSNAAVNAGLHRVPAAAGREILFVRLVGRKYGLFVMNADGTNVRTLVAADEPGRRRRGPQRRRPYSADGSRIVLPALVPGLDPVVGDERRRLRSARVLPRAGSGLGRRRHPVARWPMGRVLARHPGRDGRPSASRSFEPTGPARSVPTGPDLLGNCATSTGRPDSTKILHDPEQREQPVGILLDPAGGPWTTVPWRSDVDIDWQRLAP